MFLGIHHNKLDDKGRITLPSSFRRAIEKSGEEAFITLSKDKPCMIGFTEGLNSDLITEDTAPLSQKISYENTGRFVLSGVFRNAVQANTEKPDMVVIVGRKDYFEIWTTEDWNKEAAEILKRRAMNFSNMAPGQDIE